MKTTTIHFDKRGDGPPEAPAADVPPLGGGIASLVYGPWAILPAMTEDLIAVWNRHLRGERADIAAIEASTGRPLANKQRRFEVRPGGVAVVPVEGVMAPKLNGLKAISGGSSTQMMMRDVQAAEADPGVSSILLAHDTPGGSALGIHDFAHAIRQAALTKPVVTHSDGMICSAGYWTGSAANAIYLADPIVQAGSIGVVVAHQDVSKAQEKIGIKTTEITAGRYKRVASAYAPLSKEGRAFLQDMADDAYSHFINAVAAHRGVSVQTVLDSMADGRLFVGQRAIDAGLADGFMSQDALIESMATDPAKYSKRTIARIKPIEESKPARDGGARAATSNPAKGAPTMSDDNQGAPSAAPAPTAESIKTQHPGVYAAIRAEGVTAERERIKGLTALAQPGQEKLIAQAIDEGKTPGETALAMIAAQKQQLSAAADAHRADAPDAVTPSNVAADGAQAKVTDAKAAADRIVSRFNAANGVTQHG